MAVIQPSHILPSLAAGSKNDLLKRLSEIAADSTGLGGETVLHALLERERLGCTGVGKGFSIPHARFAELNESHAFFARLSPPVDFGAADGLPVDLVFLILSPADADTEHLKILARVARVLRSSEASNKIRNATATDLHNILSQALDEEIGR